MSKWNANWEHFSQLFQFDLRYFNWWSEFQSHDLQVEHSCRSVMSWNWQTIACTSVRFTVIATHILCKKIYAFNPTEVGFLERTRDFSCDLSMWSADLFVRGFVISTPVFTERKVLCGLWNESGSSDYRDQMIRKIKCSYQIIKLFRKRTHHET